jgi:alpha-glucosidase
VPRAPHRSRSGFATTVATFSSVTTLAALTLVPLAGACSSDGGNARLEDAGGDVDAPGVDGADGADAADAADATEVADAADAGPPTCFGIPLPAGDLAPEADGRTLRVGCASLGFDVAVSVIDPAMVRIRHVDAAAPPRGSFAVVDRVRPDPKARFGSTASTALVCAGQVLVEIDRASCRVRAAQADGTVILEDADEGGYVRDAAAGTRGVLRKTPTDERFYGFGEKTGPLDKRGRSMTFWNTDAYQDASKGYPPGADPLYQSIPFFVGLRGASAYGLFLDDTWRVRADLAKADVGKYSLVADGGEIDEYLIAGPGIPDVVQRYSDLTGRMPMPPRWTLGYHQSRWGYTDAQVRAVAAELRKRYIPADGIWLDIQHMDGNRSWTWDKTAFPDPSGLETYLHGLGFKLTVIVDPGIKVDPAWDVYQSGLSGGHFLSRGGTPYVGEVWPGASVFPDFSAAKTRTWWGTFVKRDLDLGVRGVWVDMNEPSDFTKGNAGTVPVDLPADGDGAPAGSTTMAAMHNVYGLNEARATWEGMRNDPSDHRPFVLTRAGYAGIQRYAAVWTGDAPSTWPTLRETLPMLLGMGLSGLPFVGSDVGGYSGEATPEMFARWYELGSISPFFRGHTMNTGAQQEPYAFGTEVADIARDTGMTRSALMPYWYSLFAEANATGAPILRPLVYEFQSDPATRAVDDQAMLGPWLMTAPLLTPGATTRDVYFPAGRWFEQRSGAIVEGPKTVTLGAQTLAALPLWVREGGIVLREWPGGYDGNPKPPQLYVDLYPSTTKTTLTRYDDDGDSRAWETGVSARTTYTLQRTSTGARLTAAPRVGSYVPAARPLMVRVQRVDRAPATTGGPAAVMMNGVAVPHVATYLEVLGASAAAPPTSAWTWDEADLAIVANVPDRDAIELEFTYDPTITDPAPPVSMELYATVPAGTPTTSPVCFASSANGWTHQPLGWSFGHPTGFVTVPRGEWFFYKYTRGGWSTVEKWPGCVEATNRYAFGVAHPTKYDTVYGWADACP